MFGAPQIVSCGGGGGGSGGRQGGLGQSLAGPSLCHADAQWVPARLGSGPCRGGGHRTGVPGERADKSGQCPVGR